DYNQCVKAFVEAESYNGPSIIIAYAPCVNHGIKGGLAGSQTEQKKAVASGYWYNFRYDPRNIGTEKSAFSLDSKAPTENYRDFVLNEVRYSALMRANPERAEALFAKAEAKAKAKRVHLEKLEELYK
ncbi:MAG: pyruvate:ferredoxin (flavodoxin) oxidoreductase, partial [Clostridia bacterium]|nr:pyruvate:ferredoxin (flavodoxin) oxidoreductase [Clostridia bacterium]